MSSSHHQSPEEIDAQRRMLQEFLGNAKPSFPAGRINADDQGEISFAVAADPSKQAVIIRFAKAVDWLGLRPKEAKHLAGLLITRANELEGL